MVSLSRFVPSRYRDAVLFVLTAALFGGSFVLIKTGLRELPPVLFAALRFDVAAVTLLGYVAVTRPRSAWLPRSRGDRLGIAVAATFLVLLNNAFLFLGQATTTPAAAAVMYGLNPVLAPLFAWWLLGDRISRVGAVGIAIALAGVVVIVRPSPSALADPTAVGQLLVVGAAVAVALGSVLLQRAGPRMGSVELTAWGMAVGAVLLHGLSLGAGESPAAALGVGPTTVASVVGVGIPATAVAYAVFFGLLERIGPVRTNLVAYLAPAFAALASWLALGTGVSPWTAVGFLVVVAGFGLVERETIAEELRRVRRRDRSSGRPAGDRSVDADGPADAAGSGGDPESGAGDRGADADADSGRATADD